MVMQPNIYPLNDVNEKLKQGAKILFASFPADGHFNPLTGLAFHLNEQGYDSSVLHRLQIPRKSRKTGHTLSSMCQRDGTG